MLREGIMKRALAAMMVLFAVSGCRTTRVTVAVGTGEGFSSYRMPGVRS